MSQYMQKRESFEVFLFYVEFLPGFPAGGIYSPWGGRFWPEYLEHGENLQY